MISIQKNKINTHLRIILRKLDRVKKDSDILYRWARMGKIKSAQRLSILFVDAIENLSRDLGDLQSVLEKAEKNSNIQKDEKASWTNLEYDDN